MLQAKDFDNTISEIVRSDYRTADVFRKFGINYCCGGSVKLGDVCTKQNLDRAEVQNALNEVSKKRSIPPSLQFDEWTVDFLIDYIVNVHHAYLRRSIPATTEHPRSISRYAGVFAFRRQPAEGRHQQVARDKSESDDPR